MYWQFFESFFETIRLKKCKIYIFSPSLPYLNCTALSFFTKNIAPAGRRDAVCYKMLYESFLPSEMNIISATNANMFLHFLYFVQKRLVVVLAKINQSFYNVNRYGKKLVSGFDSIAYHSSSESSHLHDPPSLL